jgi:hypothetical protein
MSNLSIKDKTALLEFAADHADHFGTIPIDFETSSGEVIPYAVVWEVCEKAGIVNRLYGNDKK